MNVSVLTMGLAEFLGFEPVDVRAFGVAGLLHDIGKIRIPVEVLTKPGRLTPAERRLMNTHPVERGAHHSRFRGGARSRRRRGLRASRHDERRRVPEFSLSARLPRSQQTRARVRCVRRAADPAPVSRRLARGAGARVPRRAGGSGIRRGAGQLVLAHDALVGAAGGRAGGRERTGPTPAPAAAGAAAAEPVAAAASAPAAPEMPVPPSGGGDPPPPRG
jgi:hypothetical protein